MFGITKRTDYALLALTHLALSGERASVRAREIAERYDIPADLLAKVMQRLAKSGILASSAGRSGGYSLARSAKDITIYTIVEAVEGSPARAHCLRSREGCQQELRCTIKVPLERLRSQVYELLSGITLSDFAECSDTSVVPLSGLSGRSH